jgi:SAM-dependent methyltransferase
VIHRAVWGPGVTTRAQAFHYVDERIADLVRGVMPPRGAHVVDLGCGVGASLCYLAERLPIRGTGITLSARQVRMASRRIAEAGLSGRVSCIEGDYCNLPAGVAAADLAYAIESFVHGPSPERFFTQCAGLVRDGGLLVVCDDCLRPTRDAAAERAIGQFVRGWRINSLLSGDELQAAALAHGFEHVSTTDLTPFLETGRPRDRVLGLAAAVLARFRAEGRFGPLIGGSALQRCLDRGWIGYDLVVFRRRAS